MTALATEFISDPIELRLGFTEDDLQLVIRAVYKQVLGNAHLLVSQRLDSAESALRNGDMTVRGFVRAVAQSELYRSMFFETKPAYRFIELNCKHFLGRAPLDQAEVARHVLIYNEQGYEAEINSYIDSDDYTFYFGENRVPFFRCANSQIGIKNNVYNQTVSLMGGFASSDSSNQAQLTAALAANMPQTIKVSTAQAGVVGSTNKRFRIVTAKVGTTPVAKQCNATYTVDYTRLTRKIQSIQKAGGTILSVTEV